MKILLVGINSKFIHSNLAVRYLKSYTNDMDYNCSILEFSINDLKERIVNEILKEKPDVIGFSCYIWNVEYVKQICNLIKLINSDIRIFAGGPEVSYNPNEFLLNNNVDNVIEGEGEETFRVFVQQLIKFGYKNNGINFLKDIKGLYSKFDGEVYYGGFRDNIDINKIVFPYKKDDDLENKIVYYEASRGCPFGCKYCLSSVDRKVRFLDIERVKRELKFFIDKRVKLVKFVDRTFNCKPKIASEIWKFIIEQGNEIQTTFHFEISADLLKKEQMEILSKASKGRIQFEVGVQTTNNDILKNINRHVNFEDIKKKVIEVEKIRNVKQHLDLIAGLPGENLESFKKSFNDVYSIKPEEIQLGFLKLLKGSPMLLEVEKWGMVYSPYPPYEILRTKDVSYEEIMTLKKVEKMVDKYYNSNKFVNILNYFGLFYDRPFDFYYDLALLFEGKGYFDRNISSVEYYNVFLLFNSEVLKKENKFLNEIIKFDYLTHNKKKWMPDFIDREFDKKFNKIIKDNVKLNNLLPYKEFHVEKIKIDIFEFIDHGIIKEKDAYIAFNEERNNEIEDITDLIKNII